jgi:hypothetical protein
MKHAALLLAFGCLLVAPLAANAGAVFSKDESNLNREAARLIRTAATPQGEKAVTGRIVKDFGVDESRVQTLRSSGLGYGEIAIAISLAQKQPGGITDANVQKVLGLRQGPPELGWGEVAKALGMKLGATVSQLKKLNNESHRDMKNDHDVQEKTPKQEETVPAAPETVQRPRKEFTGEGKDMTRGGAAK